MLIGYFQLVLCVCIINVPVKNPNIGPYGPMFLRNYKDYICPKTPNIGPFRPMFGVCPIGVNNVGFSLETDILLKPRQIIKGGPTPPPRPPTMDSKIIITLMAFGFHNVLCVPKQPHS